MSEKVLIFGANGFVGGYLIREFSEHGYEVYGSDLATEAAHPALTGYQGADLLEAAGVEKVVTSIAPDIIVNLAAISSVGQSWRNPALTMQVNVCGALNILEAARKLSESPRVLLVGSSEEYAASDKPIREADPVDATNPYGISKVTQERFAELYAEQYGMRIYRTRSFNHTGVGQNSNFVIPSWCRQVAEIERSGKPGVIRVGNLDVVRDFSDVRDVARAYRMILESDCAGEVFNVGSGEARRLRDILDRIVASIEQKVAVEVDPALIRPCDAAFIQADVSLITSMIGWAPSFSLEQTLDSMIEAMLWG